MSGDTRHLVGDVLAIIDKDKGAVITIIPVTIIMTRTPSSSDLAMTPRRFEKKSALNDGESPNIYCVLNNSSGKAAITFPLNFGPPARSLLGDNNVVYTAKHCLIMGEQRYDLQFQISNTIVSINIVKYRESDKNTNTPTRITTMNEAIIKKVFLGATVDQVIIPQVITNDSCSVNVRYNVYNNSIRFADGRYHCTAPPEPGECSLAEFFENYKYIPQRVYVVGEQDAQISIVNHGYSMVSKPYDVDMVSKTVDDMDTSEHIIETSKDDDPQMEENDTKEDESEVEDDEPKNNPVDRRKSRECNKEFEETIVPLFKIPTGTRNAHLQDDIYKSILAYQNRMEKIYFGHFIFHPTRPFGRIPCIDPSYYGGLIEVIKSMPGYATHGGYLQGFVLSHTKLTIKDKPINTNLGDWTMRVPTDKAKLRFNKDGTLTESVASLALNLFGIDAGNKDDWRAFPVPMGSQQSVAGYIFHLGFTGDERYVVKILQSISAKSPDDITYEKAHKHAGAKGKLPWRPSSNYPSPFTVVPLHYYKFGMTGS